MKPSLKDIASQNANKWAQQRKDQMDRSKQTAKDRTNFAAMGNMMLEQRVSSAQRQITPQEGSRTPKAPLYEAPRNNFTSAERQIQPKQREMVNQQQYAPISNQYETSNFNKFDAPIPSRNTQPPQRQNPDSNPSNQLRLLKSKMNSGQTNSRQDSRGRMDDSQESFQKNKQQNSYQNSNQGTGSNTNYRQQFTPSTDYDEQQIRRQQQPAAPPKQQLKKQGKFMLNSKNIGTYQQPSYDQNNDYNQFNDDYDQSSQKKPPIIQRKATQIVEKPQPKSKPIRQETRINQARGGNKKQETFNYDGGNQYGYENPNDEISAVATGNLNQPVDDPYQDENEYELEECQGCGRSFNPTSLQKHQKICKKVFQTKRKAFNTKEQRIIDDQHAQTLKQAEYEEKQKSQKQKKQGKVDDRQITGQKKPKWQAQSEAFRAILKQSGGVELSKQEKAMLEENINVGLTQCAFCGRKFNDDAAKKHIPYCESKSKKNAPMRVGPSMKQQPPPSNQKKYK